MKFLYRNSFKDIFSSNQSCSYLILLQNIIQNVITKLHYIAYSNIVPQRIKYKVSTQAHTRTHAYERTYAHAQARAYTVTHFYTRACTHI